MRVFNDKVVPCSKSAKKASIFFNKLDSLLNAFKIPGMNVRCLFQAPQPGMQHLKKYIINKKGLPCVATLHVS